MKKNIFILVLIIIGMAVYIYTSNPRTDDNFVIEDSPEYVVDPGDMYAVTQSDKKPVTDLTVEEKNWLIQMREEEKLARDVYTTLGNKWGLKIFSNVASSEQTHTDAVRTLLQRYGVPDPVLNDSVGVFTSVEMQKLYGDLTAQGDGSLLEALVVGATIEDLDISDLDQAIVATKHTDIQEVYQNLQKGSRNHMRAFVRNLESKGGEYNAQYISSENYIDIISSEQERGRI